ncbi:MAG: T9SS type A sorting domain-containing protein [Candidatus Marinimicrobia bacterium]|nr:T9SS type A sorting domain-containing protein [Candidatus Neomarinimicrobiota bacterium]
MKKSFVFLLISISILGAQAPKIDLSFRVEKASRKEIRYKALAKVNDEITDNQQLFDIQYYNLDMKINVRNPGVIGRILVVGEVVKEPISEVELNFWQGLSITKIYAAGRPMRELNYQWSGDIVRVNLDSVYAQGGLFKFYLEYAGDPSDNPYGYFAFDAYNGESLIWTLNEPYGARGWFPCKDVPSDKPDSMDIRVQVPKGFIVASNGKLVSQKDTVNSTIFHWQERYPIATYLVSLAIHPYAQFSDWYIFGDQDSMEVQYYVMPDHYSSRLSDYRKTVKMIAYYSEIFGQYPFINEKYGHAEFGWGGGMEHQTITSLGGASELLIAHELAHQWWGDAVTCHQFHDLWLNEGFASYAEALWYEYEYPDYTASDYQLYSEYFGDGTIYVEDLNGSEPLFSKGLRYDKASWVLHMLRNVVGDRQFFEILQTYYQSGKFRYKSATTEDFIEHCQTVSGLNLDQFFQQWIFEEYYPDYHYCWNSAEVDSGHIVHLTIRQEQTNTGLFWMPIDVRVSTLQADYDFRVWDSLQVQQFDLYVKDDPKLVELDPDNWILKKVKLTDTSIVKEKQINDFRLYQNYPNPFNPMTTVVFNLPVRAEIRLNVYDILGRHIDMLADGILNAGFHRVKFDGTGLPSGVYICKFEYGNQTRFKKMVLMK